MCTCNSLPHECATTSSESHGLTRRDLLKTGGTAIVGGAAGLMSMSQFSAAAQTVTPVLPSRGPTAIFWRENPGDEAAARAVEAQRQTKSRTAGMKFRALTRHRNSLTVETLTLKPIHPLQVVIRTQAVQACATSVFQLDTADSQPHAVVTGHGGVGIVEDVGNLVKRVKIGDQVILSATPNCGTCGQCLSGRGEFCAARLPALVSATMADGTPVFMTAPPMGPAGYSEILVSDEDWVIPVFTKVPPVELSMLACPGAVGLGIATCGEDAIEAGSDVVMFGLGPIGISAIQGARIQGAKTIIGVDPIRYRRELAARLGATHVLDPNALKGEALVNRIRELTPDAAPRGRQYVANHPAGARYSFEAVAPTRWPLAPGVEAPPDLTGADVPAQVLAAAREGSVVKMVGGVGQTAVPVFSMFNKKVMMGNFLGVQALRDVPRMVNMIERGQYDAKALVGRVYRPDQMREAIEVAGSRSAITSVIDFT